MINNNILQIRAQIRAQKSPSHATNTKTKTYKAAYTPGKRVGAKSATGVRIPLFPPNTQTGTLILPTFSTTPRTAKTGKKGVQNRAKPCKTVHKSVHTAADYTPNKINYTPNKINYTPYERVLLP